MKYSSKLFLKTLFIGLFISLNYASKAQAPDTLKVLFVGNSYTYYQNLPHIVSLISDSTATKIITRKSTAGGANLGHHWNGERNLRTKEIIASGNFDVVVLQDHSLGPIQWGDEFQKYAVLLCDLIKKSGAKPYFYLTWSREKVPQHQKILNQAYLQAATRNQAGIIPVGPGWTLARQLRPEAPLYNDDGSHPSDLGTYLTACIFLGVLVAEYPESLPLRYYATDSSGESVELLRMEDFDILFCLMTAKQVVDDPGWNP